MCILFRANQQPTDKFITVPLKSVLALRYTRIKFNAEDGLPTSVDPDILPGQVAPAEEFGKRRQLYMYYSYRSNVYTRRLREAVLCFMGPMDEERNHWFQLVNDALTGFFLNLNA
jgi:hypothetical protein